jgi:hypothetical protein
MSKNITIGNGATFHGDFIVGDEIRNSFNKIQQANQIPEELKSLLGELTKALEPVAKALPPERAEELTKDLATFTNEVICERPRRKWWELSLEGIKEAAQAVGAIGTKVLDLAAKVAPLLPS